MRSMKLNKKKFNIYMFIFKIYIYITIDAGCSRK